MVTNGTAGPARSGVSALGRLAAGVAAVAVSTLLAPAVGEDQPGVGGPGRGEEAPASTLLEAADALRGSALLRLEGDEMNQGPALRVLLQDLRSLAQGAAPAMWIDAELGHALLEVSVGAGRAERRQILQVATELAEVSPTEEIAGDLLRASCQVAESVLHAQGARPALDDALIGSSEASSRYRRVLAELHGQLESDGEDRAGEFVMLSRRRVACLGPGSLAPRYVARDTAGNEVRSTDFVGRITLYRVWDAASPASVAAHRLDAALLRKHWDRPFELVGISDGEDRQAHLDALPGRGVAGTQIYDGPIGMELVDALARTGQPSTASVGRALSAWHEPVAGTCILVDSRGVIRGRDLGHEELDALILELVDEHRRVLRARELER